MTPQERTKIINRLQKRHPKTRRQRSYHGGEHYSVQFFDKATGELMADYEIDCLGERPHAWPPWEPLARMVDDTRKDTTNMPNNTTLSTAEYPVTIEPQWARTKHSARTGLVIREYISPKTGRRMVAIRTDHSYKLVRVPFEAVKPINVA